MAKPQMMFFHDGRHPHIYMYEPPMQKEEYAAAIDELSGTTIDAVMFCLGEGRTMLHDTRVGELWGHNVDKWPHLIWRRTYQNAKGLIEEGNDPLRIVCDRAHEKGMLLYPTLLVQVGERRAMGGSSDMGAMLGLSLREQASRNPGEGWRRLQLSRIRRARLHAR